MISGSGNNRHRHARIRDGRQGRHAWTDRERAGDGRWTDGGPVGYDGWPEGQPVQDGQWPDGGRAGDGRWPDGGRAGDGRWTDGGPAGRDQWPERQPAGYGQRPEREPTGYSQWPERQPSADDQWTGYKQWDETETPPRAKRLKARVIVPMAIPMAMGLALGMVLALSGKTPVTRLDQSSLGVHTSTSTSTSNNTNTNTNTTTAGTNCALIVPDNALSAQGLATPWELTGPNGESPASSGCEQSNPNLRTFVQATIVDPATGALYVYEPLVVTFGSNPAATPVVPRLPKGAVVAIMVGSNGGSLTLAGANQDTLTNSKCVDGDDGSLFGRVAYCNSVAFYATADLAIADGKLTIPASGDSPVGGQRCPTVRGFALAGQNLGDGVTTEYLLDPSTGQTAQNNAANRAALPGAVAINNVGDSRLLDDDVLPALGCAPLTAPNLSAGGAPGTSQALEELSAARNQRAPVALMPESGPMTMSNGEFNSFKTDLYRLGIGQPFVDEGLTAPFSQSKDGGQQADTPANFCANMLNIETKFLATNANRFFASASPVPSVGDNLLTYMASRLSASYTGLGCASYGLKDTVRLITNSDGVATGAALTVTTQKPAGSASAATSFTQATAGTAPTQSDGPASWG